MTVVRPDPEKAAAYHRSYANATAPVVEAVEPTRDRMLRGSAKQSAECVDVGDSVKLEFAVSDMETREPVDTEVYIKVTDPTGIAFPCRVIHGRAGVYFAFYTPAIEGMHVWSAGNKRAASSIRFQARNRPEA